MNAAERREPPCVPRDLLFLSHCVPAPPDKGERIRAWHELRYLAERFRVHLACFARDRAEFEAAQGLREFCASVYAEPLTRAGCAARAALAFAGGRSLSAGWYRSRAFARYVAGLRVDATLVYTVPMVRYAPVPFVLDMVDVDSEKWLDYGRTRTPGHFYSAEGRRLRALEIRAAAKAARVLLTTAAEARLLDSFLPEPRAEVLENGVDFEHFDPGKVSVRPVAGRYLLFAGTMDYYPNAEAVGWFAREVFPELRRRDPQLAFVIAGRNPPGAVQRLASRPGVVVTGTVPDIRPYLAGALAMGKVVYASAAVCATFGDGLPRGVTGCGGAGEWIETLSRPVAAAAGIREAARARFCWDARMSRLIPSQDLAAARR